MTRLERSGHVGRPPAAPLRAGHVERGINPDLPHMHANARRPALTELFVLGATPALVLALLKGAA